MESTRINKTRLSALVVDRISQQIRSGILKPGGKLAAERKLAEEMGVSRTVIREALRIMNENGLLEVKEGSHYVKEITFDVLLSHMMQEFMPSAQAIVELMEIRMLLEAYIVRMATRNAGPKDIARIQNSINAMSALLDKDEIGYDHDISFHKELVKAAGNATLDSIYLLCSNLITSSCKASLMVAKDAGKSITAVEEHQRILDAIKLGDEDLAHEMMFKHLKYAHSNLLESYYKYNSSSSENESPTSGSIDDKLITSAVSDLQLHEEN
ncbi:MAG: FadR/GntR family transcriptional regulator [Christensenellales bacterium]|jgi:GntR family transcriptional repressor for pyruvate dehydrogenase complex